MRYSEKTVFWGITTLPWATFITKNEYFSFLVERDDLYIFMKKIIAGNLSFKRCLQA